MEGKNNNRLIAIICSLIGALIGTIPWVLLYVYGNMIVAILAVIVAFMALKGYNLAKGKMDKYTPKIIAVVSLTSISIATLVFIPMLLMLKETGITGIDALSSFYEIEEYQRAILGDYIISLLFAILGISGVISSIRNEVDPGNKRNLIMYTNINQEEGNKVKAIFEKVDALEKYNAKSKGEINPFLETEEDQLLFLKYLNHGVIKRYKGKYYFSEYALNSPVKSNLKKFFKIALYTFIIMSVIYILIILLIPDNDSSNNYEEYQEKVENKEVIQDDIIKYKVPSNWVEVPKLRKERIYYYTPDIDKTGYNGIISVSYGTTDYESDEYDLFKKALVNTYIDNKDEDVIDTKMNEIKNSKDYKIIEFIIKYDDPTFPCTEYMYYVFNGKSYGLVYLTDYYSKYVKNTKDVVYTIVNDFEFIKGEQEL